MAKKWNRKRKKEESIKKASKPRQEREDGDPEGKPNELHGYRITNPSNAKMEAYYAYQGLHHFRHDNVVGNGGGVGSIFVECGSDAEKEEERSRFMGTMQRILPVSFRIGQNIEEELRAKLVKELEVFQGKEVEIEVLVTEDGKHLNRRRTREIVLKEEDGANGVNAEDGGVKTEEGVVEEKPLTKRVAPAKTITYIPNAYQLSVDRRTLRRNPKLEAFHEWLKIQTEAGFITRQETVSMIPPVVLAPESHHHILDMCAAPGSKTSQLLEIIGTHPSNLPEPTGFVVANDSDAKRAYMLVHQLRRLNNPAAFLTCVDAQFFPNLTRGASNASPTEEGIFDRVLADVPCSGDGTARKNPGVWRHWGPLGALGLHPLQLSIALNGARLTKVGGYMCYSTCSMNPIENEAVVAELLRLADGAIHLVDRRKEGGVKGEGMLDSFWARKGWTHWKVMSEATTRKAAKNENKKKGKEMERRRIEWEQNEEQRKIDLPDTDKEETTPVRSWADEYATIKAGHKNERRIEKQAREPWVAAPPSWDEEALLQRAISTGMEIYKTFDDVPETQRKRCRASCFPPTQEEVANFNMDRCMRVLPQDMDTGGFFVALFKKTGPLNERAKRKAREMALESRPDAKRDEEVDVEMEGAKKAVPVVNQEKVGATNGSTENGAVDIEVKKDDATTNGNADTTTTTNEIADTTTTTNENADTTTTTNENTDTTTKNDDDTGNNKLVYGKPLLRGRNKSRGQTGNYDFIPIKGDILPPLIEFYGLSDSFAHERFMARNTGDPKILYFITESVRKNLIDRGVQDKVTVVTSGLRAFEKGNRDGVLR